MKTRVLEPTKVCLRTNKVVRILYNMGFNAKQIREHYNEPENSALNNHINILITKISSND